MRIFPVRLALLLALSFRWTASAQPPSLLENTLQFVLDGRVDSARQALNQQIATFPNDVRGYRARAALLSNGMNDPGDLASALSDYNRVLELVPEQDGTFYFQRGRLLSRMNLNVRAVSDLNRSVAMDPDWPKAYLVRARSQWSIGNLAESSQDLDKVIKLCPGSAEAFGLRGLIRLRQGQRSSGLSDLVQAVKLDPTSIYQRDLHMAQQSQAGPDGLSWSKFVSADGDFAVRMPVPIHTNTKDGQFIVASEFQGGHMFGVVRQPGDSTSRNWQLDSRECREAVFHTLETNGGHVSDWKVITFLGKRCLRVQLRDADQTDTDVTVVVTRRFVYFLACTRNLGSSPFDRARQARFLGSFRLLN